MLEPVLVLVIFSVLGVLSAAPSLTTGDAGELAAAASVFGVPHAPGYPTWTVLAKAFGTILPFGSWGYRMNILSVLCMSAALAVLFDALRRWGISRWGCIIATIILGLSPLWREQSAVTEVFPVSVLAAAAILWLVAAAGDRLLTLSATMTIGMVFGLGIGAHQTLILLLPAVLVAAYGRPGRLLTAVSGGIIGGCAGFLIHLVIPIRAWQHSPVNWGNAIDVNAFMRLLLRKDYGTFALTVDGARSFGFDELLRQFARFGGGLVDAMGVWGVGLAFLGCVTWKRSDVRLNIVVPLAWILCAGPLFLAYGRPGFDAQTNGALERFYLLPALGASVLAAAGVSFLDRKILRIGGLLACFVAASMLPGAMAASHRDDYMLYDYGRAILRALPPQSIFVMDGGDDTFYSMSYFAHAEHMRTDLSLYDRGGIVFPGGYGKDFRQLPRQLKEIRRTEMESQWVQTGRLCYSTLNDALLPEYDLMPAGLLRFPQKKSSATRSQIGYLETLAVRLSAQRASRSYRDRSLAAFFPYQKGLHAFFDGNARQGAYWMAAAAAVAPDALWIQSTVPRKLAQYAYTLTQEQQWDSAAFVYQIAADIEPTQAEYAINLGISLERIGQWESAERSLRDAIRREPNSARSWSTLGTHFWARQKWPDAAGAFEAAAALNPNDAQLSVWAQRARSKIK